MPPGTTSLVDDEEREQRKRGENHREHPPRPTAVALDGDRIDEQQQGRGDDEDAGDVEAWRVRRLRLVEEEPGTDERGDADRHVDVEDRAPVEPGDVELDERPAEQRPGDRR